jgi:hypothetical protein
MKKVEMQPHPILYLINREILPGDCRIFKKRVAPATKDTTMSADEIRVGGKVCFFLHAFAG